MVNVDGHNKKSMKGIVYSSLKSATKCVPHSPGTPVSILPATLLSLLSTSVSDDSSGHDNAFLMSAEGQKSEMFIEGDLNNCVREK